MDIFAEVTKRTQGLHGKIAADLAHLGGVLRCNDCGEEWALTQEDIGRHLAHGWPKHCGRTMRWVTQKELDAESSR